MKYYDNSAFRNCDQAIKKGYQWSNPYQISKQFLVERGASDIHTYGETPLTSLEQIFSGVSLTKKSMILDLGCGRGRGVFFLHHRFGCQVKGLDWIPQFIEKAQHIAASEKCDTQFICADMLQHPILFEATVIYFAWTCMEEEERSQIEKVLENTHPGTQIITVSYPLSSKKFNTQRTALVSFPWGEGEVFFQNRLEN